MRVKIQFDRENYRKSALDFKGIACFCEDLIRESQQRSIQFHEIFSNSAKKVKGERRRFESKVLKKRAKCANVELKRHEIQEKSNMNTLKLPLSRC